jgi:hypothetical protein
VSTEQNLALFCAMAFVLRFSTTGCRFLKMKLSLDIVIGMPGLTLPLILLPDISAGAPISRPLDLLHSDYSLCG